jgi:hypothetical protein
VTRLDVGTGRTRLGLGTGDAEERDGGLASGLMTTTQQIGGAIGIAAAALLALVLRQGGEAAHGARVGEVAMSSR